jgi:SAM-dependent methyltransferase
MVNINDLKQEWATLAPKWIKEVREGKHSVRDGLLDLVMLDACGDVKGLSVLDSGCGEGRFCRKLVEREAAEVVGLDLCEQMIEAAKELQSGREQYLVHDVQDLSFIDNEIFDLAISYLNQCDLPDFEANTKEVFRVLKKGGKFVIANLHPMRSASGKWYRNADGEKLHVILDNYFDEGERHWEITGVMLTNFHRSLSTYVNTFVNTGFILKEIIEPTSTLDMLDKYPDLDDELRVPNFIVFVLQKP